MRIVKRCVMLFLLALFSTLVGAEEPAPALPPPPIADAPAATPNESAPEEPTVTIVQHGEDKVAEYRVGGRVFMLKVTPKYGHPYYLVDTTGNGTFVRRNGPDPGLLVPMWVLFEW